MDADVATRGRGRTGLKFKLTHQQAMALNAATVPQLTDAGRVKLVPRPAAEKGQPYRVLDGNQEAPTGFGFYVGKTRTTYEVVRRGPNGVRRFSLGNVTDMGLEEAYAAARAKLAVVRETGESPRVVEARQREQAKLRAVTVGECLSDYLDDLTRRLADRKVKPSSVEAVRDSLVRLSRPEVGLAAREVRTLTEKQVEDAFHALRRSAMVRSNRIPTAMRAALAKHKDWAALDTATLEGMGITGKHIQRVRAAGLAAAEHSFTDAYRAVKLVLQREATAAAREGRPPALTHNPLEVVFGRKLLRSARELRKHYDKAAVRNPLSDKTLPQVLKAILARRDEQGGHNAGAADYLLLTLLWGTRRSEAAQLRWFDRCSKGELQQEEVSWVWLAAPDEINPYTKRAGSQVYMFDTKSGEERFLPVAYFAERILQRRLDSRLDDAQPKAELAAALKLRDAARGKGASASVMRALDAGVEEASRLVQRASFVFPARSTRSKTGHYSDSKSILANVRRDSGLADLREEVDQGLTTHDLRRTMGRYAALHFGESRIVSQMLHHRTRGAGGMSPVSERYTEQEWAKLRDAFGEVEEMMIARSPRVWNRLKGTDKPRMAEQRDKPATIFATRNQKVALDGD